MNITIEAKNLQKSRFMIDNVRKSLDQTIDDVLENIANKIVDDARSNLQNNTNILRGELLASIKIISQEKKSVTVGATAGHAGHIEYGRGPVRPVRAKMLHWIDKHTGEDVFSMYAGPTEPSPFLEPAIIKNTKGLADLLSENIERKIR